MWDQRFQSEQYIYGKFPNDFLVSTAGPLPKGKILSLGEGEGRNAVYLARQGHQVFEGAFHTGKGSVVQIFGQKR